MSILLQASGIFKAFSDQEGCIQLLSGIDFAIRKGEVASVCGESGCGKTTFLYTLALLERPDKGEIYWQGKAVIRERNSALASLRSTFLGFVFQAYHLVPELNVLENVLLPRRFLKKIDKVDRAYAAALLEKVKLSSKANQLPECLSGGERQRVACARALINNPTLILADEPTGNLDEKSGIEVMELLWGLCRSQGKALLVVTHNAWVSQKADARYRLHGGKLEKG